jgi:hypothetical protein
LLARDVLRLIFFHQDRAANGMKICVLKYIKNLKRTLTNKTNIKDLNAFLILAARGFSDPFCHSPIGSPALF